MRFTGWHHLAIRGYGSQDQPLVVHGLESEAICFQLSSFWNIIWQTTSQKKRYGNQCICFVRVYIYIYIYHIHVWIHINIYVFMGAGRNPVQNPNDHSSNSCLAVNALEGNRHFKKVRRANRLIRRVQYLQPSCTMEISSVNLHCSGVRPCHHSSGASIASGEAFITP